MRPMAHDDTKKIEMQLRLVPREARKAPVLPIPEEFLPSADGDEGNAVIGILADETPLPPVPDPKLRQ